MSQKDMIYHRNQYNHYTKLTQVQPDEINNLNTIAHQKLYQRNTENTCYY
uniref:Uncharacterized protein n=1 Tax=Rhizophora mucronata TaxID=61149 RepID=A0A2P2IQP3_RHIMU